MRLHKNILIERSRILALAIAALTLFACGDDARTMGTDAGMGDADLDGSPMDGGMDVPPAASCTDGVQNQDETDVDCGGTCGATCTPSKMCGANGDCTTDNCEGGTCAEAATCSDTRLNGTESDIDCGGAMCLPCADGLVCAAGTDCASGVCTGEVCQAPVCGDGIDNSDDEACDGDGMGMGGESATCNDDCTVAACGDSIVNVAAGEGCEEGGVETATCDPDCTTPGCGDGYINTLADEVCDGDGMGVGGESATCNVDCSPASCGDGVVNTAAGEACDGDGAGVGGETMTCNDDCSTSMCGDGVRNLTAGEACDDGNMVDDDLCTNLCEINGPPVTIAADAAFDTDTGMLDGVAVAGWDATTSTWFVASFDLAVAATLTVTGTEPVRIVSGGAVNVLGDIDVSGTAGESVSCDTTGPAGGIGGPGGGAGGQGGGHTQVDGFPGVGPGAGLPAIGDNAGGGGAGHLAVGESGVADGTGTGGMGGPMYLAGLIQGGSGGGGGSTDDDTPLGPDAGDDGGGSGGGGGGGILFQGLGDITVSGTIDASGGAGGGTTCDAGSGGGGSGGTIMLFATGTIDFAAATLNVDGGAGSTAGSDSGAGSAGEVLSGAIPTCSDGVLNQDETALDCGGSICGGCAAAEACVVDRDCAVAGCLDSVCLPDVCGNMAMDGLETDVDCGGTLCAPCADLLMCVAVTDCASGVCDGGTCISCDDGVRNGTETDVDCGGSDCAPCADTLMCAAPTDCASGACDGGICISCVDGIINGTETDVDCGGADCGGCVGGLMCTMDTDCLAPDCDAVAMTCAPVFVEDFEAPLGPEWVGTWFLSTTSPISGLQSAESADIDNSETSTLVVTIDCSVATTVSFAYGTSTENNFDFLEFDVDGVEQVNHSGTTSGTEAVALTAGMRTLEWRYSKDGSVSTGRDAVWIDDVIAPFCVVVAAP